MTYIIHTDETPQERQQRIESAHVAGLESSAKRTPLAECAAWHEQETRRLLALHKEALLDCDQAFADALAEQAQKHAIWAIACHEHDPNESEAPFEKLSDRRREGRSPAEGIND